MGTKGLQCPGIRIGWVVASKKNIETMQNFSSFGMGGVSHPSQLYCVKLLEPSRVKQARAAIQKHYSFQRERYGKAFEKMGLTRGKSTLIRTTSPHTSPSSVLASGRWRQRLSRTTLRS